MNLWYRWKYRKENKLNYNMTFGRFKKVLYEQDMYEFVHWIRKTFKELSSFEFAVALKLDEGGRAYYKYNGLQTEKHFSIKGLGERFISDTIGDSSKPKELKNIKCYYVEDYSI